MVRGFIEDKLHVEKNAHTEYLLMAGAIIIVNEIGCVMKSYYTGNLRFEAFSGALLFRLFDEVIEAF